MLAFLNSYGLKTFSHSTSPDLSFSHKSLKVFTNLGIEKCEKFSSMNVLYIKYH